jgi:YD repeat-containing protein
MQERLEGTRAGVASLEDSPSIEYDAAGRAVRVVSHVGQVVQRRYDALGRLTRVAGPAYVDPDAGGALRAREEICCASR